MQNEKKRVFFADFPKYVRNWLKYLKSIFRKSLGEILCNFFNLAHPVSLLVHDIPVVLF